MNARLVKETRDLLPAIAGALLLIVVPNLIWRRYTEVFGCIPFALACVVLGGCSFGNEFQHRTLSLLLSQPIARSVIWREKMLVLGAGMVASLAALLICLAVRRPAIDHQDWLVMALISLCAFCGAPFGTLMLRQGIGGMVAAVGFPIGIMAACAFGCAQVGANNEAALVATMVSVLLLYCALVYWQGYAKFKRLEAVDGSARELGLPAGMEAFFVRPLARVGARFHSPFATLIKKEFRLQQTSFLLAGLFFLIAVAGACLIKRHRHLAEAVVGADCVIYVVILPLIAGALSLAEEKGWGIAEWHLTLPPSALKQWLAKMLATLSTSLALGLLLPTALFLAGESMFRQPGGTSLPPAPVLLSWILGVLLLTSVAVYAASFSHSTLRAVLAAVGIVVLSLGTAIRLGSWAYITSRSLASGPSPSSTPALPVLCGGLFLLLCLTQWFAWSNFRRFGLPVRRFVLQLLVIFFAVGLIALAVIVGLLLTHVVRN